MTIAEPRSDKMRKVEPPSPETDLDEAPELTDEFFERAVWEKDGETVYNPILNAYRSWELAIDELHALTVRLLQDDHA